jgi:peptide/nickel transport system permease protein
MLRFSLKRTLLGVLTLFQVSIVVFVLCSVLPGDPGRRILGPFAAQSSVDALNRALGADKPLLKQYAEWFLSAMQGDLGVSYAYNVPVNSLVGPALANSLKLAALAFLMVIPLAIAGGVVAALKRDGPVDRIITLSGLTLSVLPEFVTGICLILMFALWIPIFPTTADAPPGSGPFVALRYIVLPAATVAILLFGYIARVTRFSTIEALDADYTRTALMKGHPTRVVLRRHVLPNALMPTIAVIATQAGVAMGSLVVTETLFNYPGLGRLIFSAANDKDFPLLEGSVLVVGLVFVVTAILADIAYVLLDPRIRLGATR